MSADIELALIGFPERELPSLENSLPSRYVVENRTSSGWGAVIRATDENHSEEVDASIGDFLAGLEGLENLISPHNGVLRVAIYNDKISCTFRLQSFEQLSKFGVVLEISVYPSAD